MTGSFRADAEAIVAATEALILQVVRKRVPSASLQRIGPIDFASSPIWSCWIVTSTDKERDHLGDDDTLLDELWRIVREQGLPPDWFVFQSQETVDREFQGSWFLAMR